MFAYLQSTEIINWEHPAVRALAQQLSGPTAAETIQRCYEWTRDTIRHSVDYGMNPTTCSADEVLSAGTGFCYAKSHLLAALLRANGIPTGLCYQRLSLNGDGAPYCLHGLNAVYLENHGWYRLDPRGNKPGVDAQFTPPVERLAFIPDASLGESDLPGIYADPLPEVVHALRTYPTFDAVLANLPDVEIDRRP